MSDLNSQIENILPERVARRASEIELRREPILVLFQRIQIKGVAWNKEVIQLRFHLSSVLEGRNRPGQLATLSVNFSACPPRISLRSSEI